MISWVRNSVKDENLLVSLSTRIRNFSASSLALGVIVNSLPKFLSNLVGWALRAAFLVLIFLVASHPVMMLRGTLYQDNVDDNYRGGGEI